MEQAVLSKGLVMFRRVVFVDLLKAGQPVQKPQETQTRPNQLFLFSGEPVEEDVEQLKERSRLREQG